MAKDIKKQIVSCSVSKQIYEELKTISEESGRRISEVIRCAINQFATDNANQAYLSCMIVENRRLVETLYNEGTIPEKAYNELSHIIDDMVVLEGGN